MELLTDLPGQLNKLPAAVIIALGTLVIGLGLKRAKLFPNKFIPLTVIIICAVLYWACGDPGSISPDMRHPDIALALYGAILGCAVWLAHATILKRLEKYLPAGFFHELEDNTTKFKKRELGERGESHVPPPTQDN